MEPKKRDHDFLEAEEVKLRSSEERRAEADNSADIGMHTAKVMADRINFHMQPSADSDDLQVSKSGKQQGDPKIRKVVAAALVASCLGSLTVWCLALPYLKVGKTEELPAKGTSERLQRMHNDEKL